MIGKLWGKRTAIDAFIGAIFSMVFVIPLILYLDVLDEDPYTDVRLLEFIERPEEIVIKVAFKKNDGCKFNKLSTFVKTFDDGWTVVPWVDTDVPAGDRLLGEQTLRIVIDTSKVSHPLDTLQIRTRHLCGEEQTKTDKVFLSLELTQ